MAFPTNPTNGQQATVNGVIYTYSTALTAWSVTTNAGANVSANNIAAVAAITGATVSASGNINASYFLGNGSQLSGIITSVSSLSNGTSNVTAVSSGGNITVGVGGTNNVAVFANGTTVLAGNLIPSANGVYSIGSPTALWASVYVSANTIYLGNTAVSANANTLTVGSNVVVTTTSAGNVAVTGFVSATGNVTGNYILGNGSQLTGVASGNSSIAITVTTISANTTIASGQNGFSVGPVATANNVQVSIADGQRWVII